MPARKCDDCVQHSSLESDIDTIKKDVHEMKTEMKSYLKWSVFAFIIAGLCAIGMLIISLSYRDAVKITDALAVKTSMINDLQTNRINVLEARFTTIDEKLDRNWEIIKESKKRK